MENNYVASLKRARGDLYNAIEALNRICFVGDFSYNIAAAQESISTANKFITEARIEYDKDSRVDINKQSNSDV